MIDKLTYALTEKSMRFHSWGIISLTENASINFYGYQLNDEVVDTIARFYNGTCSLDIIDNQDYANRVKLKWSAESETEGSTFLFCRLICKSKTDGILCFFCDTHSKLWVNSKIAAVVTKEYDTNSYVPLNKGENIIVIELKKIRRESTFGLYLENAAGYFKNKRLNKLNTHENIYGLTSILYQFKREAAKCLVEFILVCNDWINIDADQVVKLCVRDLNSRKKIKEISCRFNQKMIINIFEDCEEEILWAGCLVLSIYYKVGFETEKIIYLDELFYTSDRGVDELVRKSTELLASGTELTGYDKLALRYYINSNHCYRPDLQHQFIEMMELSDVLYLISSKRHLDDILYEPGAKRKFYMSALDEQVVSYTISIPENYSFDKQTPLLIIFPITKYSDEPSRLSVYTKKGVIAASISGRGVTLGSYIGEAAIWETVADIKKTFNIDETRTYAMGFSNGASAAWAQAQCHPHLFAEIIPIAGSAQNQSIFNVSNINVMNISSKADYLYPTEYLSQNRRLRKFSLYEGLAFDNMIHTDFCNIPYEATDILDEMLQVQTNYYPNQIIFRTEKNRHLKSFWISLEAIPYGKKYSYIKAQIFNQIIHITVRNTNGVTITLPPQIDPGHFQVVINAKHTNAPVSVQLQHNKRNNLRARHSDVQFIYCSRIRLPRGQRNDNSR